ncbi:MAG: rhodanese-like domain-containing protein [Candidatus Binatia bacterium]
MFRNLRLGTCLRLSFAISLVFLLTISVLLVLSFGVSFRPQPFAASQQAAKFTLIKAEELKGWLDQGRSFLLIDARLSGQFTAGHIPTAVNRPFSQYSNMGSKEHPRDLPIVFYCSGNSGSKYDPCLRAIVQELNNGSSHVYWFKDGLRAWQAQGYPVVKPPSKEVSQR